VRDRHSLRDGEPQRDLQSGIGVVGSVNQNDPHLVLAGARLAMSIVLLSLASAHHHRSSTCTCRWPTRGDTFRAPAPNTGAMCKFSTRYWAQKTPKGSPCSQPGRPKRAALPPYSALDFTLDGYYGYNFNRPAGRVNLLRAYDVSSNSFSISQATVILEEAPDVSQGRRFARPRRRTGTDTSRDPLGRTKMLSHALLLYICLETAVHRRSLPRV
jgi:hypothetical protein